MRWDWTVPQETVRAVLDPARPLDERLRVKLRAHAAVLVSVMRARPHACAAEDVALAVKVLTEALYGYTDLPMVAMAVNVRILLDVVDPVGALP
ncbi:hypothetical protein AB0D04_24135 [Streptomyces sp. NPDC048483]|uniref:hypothetical protein n=1 Tax=Streptomyces sp. NPDC048483 TaxID=3154927 RepID=UPI00344038AB